jgi:channel protein (hemolysin III family)
VLVGTHADPLQLAALAVYGAGLLATVGASALYAWGRGGRRHTLYRDLDHAAIFVMIAGTYKTVLHGGRSPKYAGAIFPTSSII